MYKRVIAGLLVLLTLFQFASCTYVEDALYDMGVNVDFEEVEEEIASDANSLLDSLKEKFDFDFIDSLKSLIPSSDKNNTSDQDEDLLELEDMHSDKLISAVDQYMNEHKNIGLCTSEYELADQILNENIADPTLSAFMSRINNEWTDNIISVIQAFGDYEETDIYYKAILMILKNCVKVSESSEMANALEEAKEYADTDDVEKIKKGFQTIKKASEAPKYSLSLTCYLLKNSSDKDDIAFVELICEQYKKKHGTSASNLDFDQVVEAVEDYGEQYFLKKGVRDAALDAISIGINIYETTVILNKTEILSLILLREIFKSMDTTNSKEEEAKKCLLKALDQVQSEYNSKLFLGCREVCQTLAKNLETKAITECAKKILGGEMTAVLSFVDFVKWAFLQVSGISDKIESTDDYYQVLTISGLIDCKFSDYYLKYKNSGFSEDEYHEFEALYNLDYGLQIIYNTIAKSFAGNDYDKEILDLEIAHISGMSIYNWKSNPYAEYASNAQLSVPDKTMFDGTIHSQWIDALFSGNGNTSGIETNWEDASSGEKAVIAKQLDKMKGFADDSVTGMYILELYTVKTENGEIFPATKQYSFLITTKNNYGILIRFFYESSVLYYLGYAFLSDSEVTALIENDLKMNFSYFFIEPNAGSNYITDKNLLNETGMIYVDSNDSKTTEVISSYLYFDMDDSEFDIFMSGLFTGIKISNRTSSGVWINLSSDRFAYGILKEIKKIDNSFLKKLFSSCPDYLYEYQKKFDKAKVQYTYVDTKWYH